MDRAELIERVGRAFASIPDTPAPWPDPWPDHGDKPEDAYSRVTAPERYRIIGARVDAWEAVLSEMDAITVDRDPRVRWRDERRERIGRTDRWSPHAVGAIALVVARTDLDGHEVGVLLGAGDPATLVERFPDCGCDACDSGSQNELDELDRLILGVVTGTFRRLMRDTVTISVDDDPESFGMGWSGHGPDLRRVDGRAILDDPVGWDEVSGSSWVD